MSSGPENIIHFFWRLMLTNSPTIHRPSQYDCYYTYTAEGSDPNQRSGATSSAKCCIGLINSIVEPKDSDRTVNHTSERLQLKQPAGRAAQ